MTAALTATAADTFLLRWEKADGSARANYQFFLTDQLLAARQRGPPALLLVTDVGRNIQLYAEFSRPGATYAPSPARACDPRPSPPS